MREAAARERKEHELFAARTAQADLFAARAHREERERHAALLEEAHARIMQLQELADDAALNEELRAALTKNGELEVRFKIVRDELEEARQEAEAQRRRADSLERLAKGATKIRPTRALLMTLLAFHPPPC